MYLGIEIGGTKLQIGIGPGDGTIAGLWRGKVDPAAGAEGIRTQIAAAIPELLQSARTPLTRLKAVGVGFGGPVDDTTQSIINSHQVEGWNNFPLAQWLSDALKVPAFLGNDADVAGLAEAIHGAGQGLSPIFYITIGSGIGGGFIINGEIYRAVGKGAAEIGHLRIDEKSLEEIASGWGISRRAKERLNIPDISTEQLAALVKRHDPLAQSIFAEAIKALAKAVCSVIVLLCPKRIVIGGGVSMIGEEHFFKPLRQMVAAQVFAPFAGMTDIVPAALGEAVVVHGALALAKKRSAGYTHPS